MDGNGKGDGVGSVLGMGLMDVTRIGRGDWAKE